MLGNNPNNIDRNKKEKLLDKKNSKILNNDFNNLFLSEKSHQTRDNKALPQRNKLNKDIIKFKSYKRENTDSKIEHILMKKKPNLLSKVSTLKKLTKSNTDLDLIESLKNNFSNIKELNRTLSQDQTNKGADFFETHFRQ